MWTEGFQLLLMVVATCFSELDEELEIAFSEDVKRQNEK